MKLNETVTANALAVTSIVIYLVCLTLVAVIPELFFGIYRPWFHGINIGMMRVSYQPNLPSVIWGLLTLSVVSWLTGYLFAKVYNYFLKKK